VICGIRATAPGVSPQPKRRFPQLISDTIINLRTNRNRIRKAALIVNFFRPRIAPGHRSGVGGHDSGGMGTCAIPMARRLLAPPPFGIVPLRPFIPGGRCSQGGVKVPTGGKGGQDPSPRAPSSQLGKRVSRFGAIPKPTVKVRMKENGCGGRALARGQCRSVCPDSGPERGKP
jgi:hypothetical protein